MSPNEKNYESALRAEHFGCAPALVANARLGWKLMPTTNTLAYQTIVLITQGLYTTEPTLAFALYNDL